LVPCPYLCINSVARQLSTIGAPQITNLEHQKWCTAHRRRVLSIFPRSFFESLTNNSKPRPLSSPGGHICQRRVPTRPPLWWSHTPLGIVHTHRESNRTIVSAPPLVSGSKPPMSSQADTGSPAGIAEELQRHHDDSVKKKKKTEHDTIEDR
jgi:hypothetical protein